ncbi:hypothetical protein MASR1M48_16670 [Lactococcus petauri]
MSRELQLLNDFKAEDGDKVFLQGSNDFNIDVSHISVSKVYALSIKCAPLFNAVKELKQEGFTVEPQLDFQNEKIILMVTRTVLDTEGIEDDSNDGA